MMSHSELWSAYTNEVLSWKLGQKDDTAWARPELSTFQTEAQAQAIAARILRLHAASGRAHCILLGVGDGSVARHVAAGLPASTPPLVLEASPAAVRAALPHLASVPLLPLLVDTSPWALLLLTSGAGLEAAHCTLAWTGDKNTPGHGPLETWRRLFSGARPEPLPAPVPSSAGPRISVGCILHPDEPRLEQFFAHIPPWVHEVVIVWDSAPASVLPACSAPLRIQVRPLNGDFAAQRNAMLDLCTGDWCLYLDADERLAPEAWERLPGLASADMGGVCFPRLTFEGDEAHVRVGYGLWPDVQLRFFPLLKAAPGIPGAAPRFTGTVHERLTGLTGPVLLTPGIPLLHYSHVHKNRAALTARLEIFSQAGEAPQHLLSPEYPRLSLEILQRAWAVFGSSTALRLPLPQTS